VKYDPGERRHTDWDLGGLNGIGSIKVSESCMKWEAVHVNYQNIRIKRPPGRPLKLFEVPSERF
jgi:hypothetical protein